MDLQLTGRTAIVTGASRGIGLATVQRLHSEGAHVVAVARHSSAGLDGIATFVEADLTRPDAPDRIVTAAESLGAGGIDLLVNNLGGVAGGDGHVDGFASISDDDWLRTFELNLFATVRMTRAALPGLLRRRGVIVNVSSIGARIAHAPVDYGAAKAALTNLTKALAEEHGAAGLRAVTVSPGPTRTDNWTDPESLAGQLAEAQGQSLDDLLESLPGQMGITTGRLAEPSETAALIAFLASPLAANITGTDYLVDGGVVKTV